MSAGQLFETLITPRFTDLDTWRHINNTRLYHIHQEARMRTQMELFGRDAWFSDDVRLRPLRCLTDYRLVSWYDSDLLARVQILDCDSQGFRVISRLYQNDELVGEQQCLMAAFEQHHRVPLPQQTLERLQGVALGAADPLPGDAYRKLFSHPGGFPVHQQLTPRYGDMDVDSQRSEAALARWMEQARFGGIRQLEMGGLGVLVAATDMSYEHYRPGFHPVELVSGISRIGNSSFIFTGGCLDKGELQASANTVMVVIDPATDRPVPIPPALREQLQAWLIPGLD